MNSLIQKNWILNTVSKRHRKKENHQPGVIVLTEISTEERSKQGAGLKNKNFVQKAFANSLNIVLFFNVALATNLTIGTAVVLFGGQNNGECLGVKDNYNGDNNGTEY